MELNFEQVVLAMFSDELAEDFLLLNDAEFVYKQFSEGAAIFAGFLRGNYDSDENVFWVDDYGVSCTVSNIKASVEDGVLYLRADMKLTKETDDEMIREILKESQWRVVLYGHNKSGNTKMVDQGTVLEYAVSQLETERLL